MKRRQFLVATGLAATTVVAGCSDGDPGSEQSSTGSPDAVVGAYINLNDQQITAGELDALLHSESPIDPEARAAGSGDPPIEGVDWSVSERQENLSEAELGAAVETESGFELPQRSIETVAAQPNQLVELSVDFDVAPDGLSEQRIERAEQRLQFRMELLIAEEDGQWLVVDDSLDVFADLDGLLADLETDSEGGS